MTPDRQSADVGGIRISYSVMGTGPDTLMLHGGGPGCTTQSDFARVYPDLARSRRLIMVDLPQFGLSDAPRITGAAWSFHAECVWRLLDLLQVSEVDIVGQSLGGSVGIVMALRCPARVRRIVATSSQPIPHPSSNSGLGLEARWSYYGGDGPSLEKMSTLISELEWRHAGDVPADLVATRFMDSTRPHAQEMWLDAQARGVASDITDRLAGLDSPTLLIMGQFDPFAPPQYGVVVADALPHGDLLVMSDTSHHPQQERPLDYINAVSAFLR
jgi:pimeloyl-ACP methyl ester carboxylesterase